MASPNQPAGYSGAQNLLNGTSVVQRTQRWYKARARKTSFHPGILTPEWLFYDQLTEAKADIVLTSFSSEKRAFLSELTGRIFAPDNDEINGALFYADYILCNTFSDDLISEALPIAKRTRREDVSLDLLRFIVNTLKNKTYVSVNEMVRGAVENLLLAEDCDNPGKAQDAARQLMIAGVGRLTMLFRARFNSANWAEFGLDAEQAKLPYPVSCNSSRWSERPVLELLNLFQDLLPTKANHTSPHLTSPAQEEGVSALPEPVADAIYASCVNAYTLCGIGGVKLRWVGCLGSHLEYDSVNRTLNLFCLLSFCRVNACGDTLFSSTLDDYYQGRHRPEGLTASKLLEECMATYKLLFMSEPKAQKIWQNQEKARAAKACGGKCDPVLKILCSRKNIQQVPSFTGEFPIFGDRLRFLQSEMLRQHPSRISALWQDRRDILRFYTFWAVLAIGIIGLILGIIQTAFSGVQTAYTIKSYRLSLKQL